MLVIHLISPDGSLDQQYISNYATINIKDVLTRIDGVGDTIVFGARDYSMRVWLDPAKVQARGLTASDVVTALARRQRAGGGRRHQPAAGDLAGRVRGRGADARPAVEPRPVQRHRRRHRPGRPGDAGARHRAGRAWLAGLYEQRLSRQQGRDRDRHLSAAGLERARDRGRRARHDGRARQELPAGPRATASPTTPPSSSSNRSTR